MIKLGKQVEENQSFRRYVGFAPVKVLCVNPNKAQLAEIGINVNDEPVYKTQIEVDGKKVNQTRVTIYVQTTDNDNKVDIISNVNFFCTNEVNVNRDKTKFQVIDNFGESSWVTKEQYQTKALPPKTKMFGDYRPAKRGEVELTKFIKYWAGIEDRTRWDNNAQTFVPVNDVENCDIQLNWEDIMSGKLEEIKGLIAAAKEKETKENVVYKIKVLFGVQTTSEGRRYQTIFSRDFMRNNNNGYTNFYKKNIEDYKKSGGMANVEYSAMIIHEYIPEKSVVTPSDSPIPDTIPETNSNDLSDLNDLPF